MSLFQGSLLFIDNKKIAPTSLHTSRRSHNNISWGSTLRISTSCQNRRGYYGGCSTQPHEDGRRKLPLPLASVAVESPGELITSGIGIEEFLRGKNYFITGGTGFVGKVLIEKLLRSVPSVGKIFLLINAKNREAAMERLKNELLNSQLFQALKQMHGESYEAFMLGTLIPVPGSLGEDNLGMDADSVNEVAEEIDIIISSAANTTFDESYDIALNINTKGPCRLLHFAKKCKKTRLFLHVSTAYVNGSIKGVIMEKPLCMGVGIAKERSTSQTPCPILDVHAEMKLASDSRHALQDNAEAHRIMKQLGLERARTHGWKNTYEFTKAMGEMLIHSMRDEMSIVIIRPSIIESTYKEPFPGWIQGNRMLDPFLLAYGKGILPACLANPKGVLDLIPVDMVVKAIVAATAKHGTVGEPDLNVYHVASSIANPLTVNKMFKFSHEYFSSSPLMDSKGKRIDIGRMNFFCSMDDFSSYIRDFFLKQSGLMEAAVSDQKLSPRILERKCKAMAEHVIQLSKIYEPYGFSKGWFDNGNTEKLMQDMSEEEKGSFGFDIKSIEWKDYLFNVHIPGLLKHVMNTGGMTQ